MLIDDIEKKILSFCEAEGLLQERMQPHAKFQFVLKITYPPGHPQPKNIVVLVPKGKMYVSIELGTKISPEHLETFKKMEEQGKVNFLPFFFHLLRNMLLQRNLFYNFNMKNQSYIISEHIYFDGLSMDRFYQCLRKVYYAAISSLIIINEVVSGKFKGFQIPSMKMGPAEEPDSSTEDLFYS